MNQLHGEEYRYLEEINLGILKQLPTHPAGNPPMVLDVGCGSGALAEAIRDKGFEVWGIERDVEAANTAARRLTKVICEDLTDLPAIENGLKGQLFDYLVFSDVLEHLCDPLGTLRDYLSFLKRGGQVLISVPNVVVWENRIKVLLGRFEYCDAGVMDRTHLRFFTFGSVRRLVEASGCRVIKMDFTPHIIRAVLPLIKRLFLKERVAEPADSRRIIDSPSYGFYLKYVYPIEYGLGRLRKELFAFRIIAVGLKDD